MTQLSKPIGSLFLLCCLVLGTGCTTVTRGTKDVLVIESNPPGAKVELSNGLQGKTPTSFELPRKHALVVTISKEGYETVSVNVTPKIVGAGGAGMAGNVLVGGLIGAAVDAGTGAMKDLFPNPIYVEMVKLPESGDAAAGSTAMSLKAKLEELEELKTEGLITEAEYEKRRSTLLAIE
ncbi:MAG: hypothetical protein SynsKO_35670 [Synoicihabitans sp.]